MRPVIAVAGVPLRGGIVPGWRDGAVGCPSPYLDALDRAGALGVVLAPDAVDGLEAHGRLAPFAGLLLVGGGDVDPARYGATAHPAVSHVNPRRDAFEIALLEAALERGLPTLAICRGAQVLNVALGGTLHQHIGDLPGLLPHRGAEQGTGVRHPVWAEAGSRVARASGAVCSVMSNHHQALDVLGRGLVVTARAEDGVVEAVECGDGWVLGVQWHAEATAAADPLQQAVFDAFAREAAGRDVIVGAAGRRPE